MVAACPFPTWQGSQVLIRQMAEILSSRGHSVHVVTYGYGEYELSANYFVHRIPALPFYRSFRSGPSALKLLLDPLLAIMLFWVAFKEKIHIIHAHNHEGVLSAFPVSKLLGIPLVYHSHTILSKELHTYFSSDFLQNLSRQLAPLVDRLSASIANHLVAVSDEEMKFFASLGKDPHSFSRVTPGVFIEDADSALAQTSEHTICYMGNLDRYQDLVTLYEALRLAKRKNSGVELHIVTRSAWDDQMCEIKKRGLLGSVHFTRPETFDQAQSILENSAIAVITRNIPTGFPIKLLNYMACGRAIIASRSAANALKHGDTAYIVEDGDAEGFARGIVTLLEDRTMRIELGRKARDLAKKQFSWEARVGQLEAIYQGLLSEEPEPAMA